MFNEINIEDFQYFGYITIPNIYSCFKFGNKKKIFKKIQVETFFVFVNATVFAQNYFIIAYVTTGNFSFLFLWGFNLKAPITIYVFEYLTLKIAKTKSQVPEKNIVLGKFSS